ncbi:autophagy-related protein 18f [Amborella trichopoda]|uniref:Uncharacterized protein n=1 Tax=Amborella trichopoda TaxID=13333 RepID=W1PNZ1_AMBTC|nr:autophagy-related protein 18f [Amborella trichopoda]ERN09529.1 hypothetical protein AMTR_s00029p00138620 [Amborella trichopoda]|eukprot:XP_011624680.1 autophagy-related protein 18f [Amborella trichopoda]
MKNSRLKLNRGASKIPLANGFLPGSLGSIKGYWRYVSSGASCVASTVKSAGASVTSSLPRWENTSLRDQVQWAGFDKLECEDSIVHQVLLLGYTDGFQVWKIEDSNDVVQLVSKQDGPAAFLQVVPKPIVSLGSKDNYESVRPILALVGTGDRDPKSHDEMGYSQASDGNSRNFSPSILKFYSLKSHSYVHELKFRSAICAVRCSPRIVAVAQAIQIHCFDTATLQSTYTVMTYPASLGCGGSGHLDMGYGPLAVGPRWFAYAGIPVPVSNTGRVSPVCLTCNDSSSTSSVGSSVAHYAKESSKQIASGLAALGDKGCKKLTKYWGEFLPDNNRSMRVGRQTPKNGHYGIEDANQAEHAGTVIVRDIIRKSVVTQFKAHDSPISALCFDRSGTLLVTASIQGHNINVFRIMPDQHGSSGVDPHLPYVHLYKLQRGLTNAVIQDISFSDDSCWIMISSSRGTGHLFAISPYGGMPRLQSHGIINGMEVTKNKSFSQASSVGPLELDQQKFASGPPLTLSVVGRIKDQNNGWSGPLGDAVLAATSRVSLPSLVVASAFLTHSPKAHQSDESSVTLNPYILIFTPCGYVTQYGFHLSSGAQDLHPRTNLSGFSGASNEPKDDLDLRLVINKLHKWDVCQREHRIEREEDIAIYDEHRAIGLKPSPDYISYADSGLRVMERKVSSQAKYECYVSNAELQTHQAGVPVWDKPKISFQAMVIDYIAEELDGIHDGDIEIEIIPTRPILHGKGDQFRNHEILPSRPSVLVRKPSKNQEDGKFCKVSDAQTGQCNGFGCRSSSKQTPDWQRGFTNENRPCLPDSEDRVFNEVVLSPLAHKHVSSEALNSGSNNHQEKSLPSLQAHEKSTFLSMTCTDSEVQEMQRSHLSFASASPIQHFPKLNGHDTNTIELIFNAEKPSLPGEDDQPSAAISEERNDGFANKDDSLIGEACGKDDELGRRDDVEEGLCFLFEEEG